MERFNLCTSKEGHLQAVDRPEFPGWVTKQRPGETAVHANVTPTSTPEDSFDIDSLVEGLLIRGPV